MTSSTEQKWLQSMQLFLKTNVPPEIQAVLNRGGVNDRDWAWLRQEENDDPEDYCPMNVLMRADEYLLYPNNQEKHERGLLVFRKAITIMSFVPSGVRLFGLHISADTPGFVEDDEYESLWSPLSQIRQEKSLGS